MQGKDIGRKTMKIKHATLKKTLENVLFLCKTFGADGLLCRIFFRVYPILVLEYSEEKTQRVGNS